MRVTADKQPAAQTTGTATPMQTTAELLTAHKDRVGLPDDQLAAALGVSQPTFSDWRTGRTVPSDRYVERLAALLGMDENDVAAAASYSRRKRATDLDEALGLISQLTAENRRLAAQVETLAQRVDQLERKAPGPGRAGGGRRQQGT